MFFTSLSLFIIIVHIIPFFGIIIVNEKFTFPNSFFYFYHFILYLFKPYLFRYFNQKTRFECFSFNNTYIWNQLITVTIQGSFLIYPIFCSVDYIVNVKLEIIFFVLVFYRRGGTYAYTFNVIT